MDGWNSSFVFVLQLFPSRNPRISIVCWKADSGGSWLHLAYNRNGNTAGLRGINPVFAFLDQLNKFLY